MHNRNPRRAKKEKAERIHEKQRNENLKFDEKLNLHIPGA